MTETMEDVAVTINVLQDASDADGDRLRIILVRALGESKHVVTTDGQSIRFVPEKNFSGTVTLAYGVYDGKQSVNAQWTVQVSPVNDPPEATALVKAIHGRVALELVATDAEKDALTYELLDQPSHGTLTGVPPQLEYVPAPGFFGEDTFHFQAKDAVSESPPQSVRLLISTNTAPVAAAQTVTVVEDLDRDVVLRATDHDNDMLSYEVTRQPAHGTLVGTAPNLTYRPAPNFFGLDSFEFAANDGALTSAPATVQLEVAGLNDPPVASSQTVTTAEDHAVAVTLSANDPDGDTLQYSIVSYPQHGTLVGSGALYSYNPAANYQGSDSFAFRVVDPSFSASQASVSLVVTSVDDPPTANPISAFLSEDSSRSVLLSGSDGDGDPLSFMVTAPPSHGALTGTPPNLTYVPAANFNGTDSFQYVAIANGVTSSPVTGALTVDAVNDPPITTNASAATSEDTAVAVTLQASDVDSTRLTYGVTNPSADGSWSGFGSQWTYTPAANATGVHSFTFVVSDGSWSTSGTVTIDIAPVNDAPTIGDDFVMTDAATAVTVQPLSNDSDAEGDALTIDSVEAPAHGDVELSGDSLVYTPHEGFSGTELFGYTVIDPHGAASTGTVHVGVGSFPPGAPRETIAAATGALDNVSGRSPAISSDGRIIAFVATTALLADDTNGVADIYVYDRRSRVLTRASVASDGAQANAGSFRPKLSADGRYVAFDSGASNLVLGDTNGAFDVFRRDRVTGETVRVSVSTSGGEGNSSSFAPSISDDGNLIAFESLSFNLVSNDVNGAGDVFVRDVSARTTTRVSVTSSGGEADLASAAPALSGDGQVVAFSSQATNLVAGDTNAVADAFVRDLGAGTTSRVSVSSTGGEANAASSGVTLSRDGRFVGFRSGATNLVVPSQSAGTIQLFVRDRQASTTTRPQTTGVIDAPRLSADGRYAAAGISNGAAVMDRFAATVRVLPATASELWKFPAISANGRYIVVTDSATGAVVVLPNPL
jgi:Bacterial Ig domain/WD40-like Beta Propeller Repeat